MVQDKEIGITDHLEELRRRLIISIASVGLFTAISFAQSDALMNLITRPVQERIYSLYFFSPYEAFMTKLKVSFVSGIIFSLPVIFTQLWLFVSPGLYPREQRLVIPLVSASTLLFLFGVCLAYFLVIPLALNFFLGFETPSLQPLISIGSYISFFLSFLLIFGLTFDFPVLLVGLISLGVIGTSFLAKQRKIMIVLFFILAAIVTPTADIFTQCLLALPLWVLYEISIWIGRKIERKQSLKTVNAQDVVDIRTGR